MSYLWLTQLAIHACGQDDELNMQLLPSIDLWGKPYDPFGETNLKLPQYLLEYFKAQVGKALCNKVLQIEWFKMIKIIS